MTIQYNVPVKVVLPSQEYLIEHSLRPYRVFSDTRGHLDRTCFSREQLPYVGEVIVVKTLKKEAAEVAHEVLSRIEGLLVLPITECDWEKDRIRNAELSELVEHQAAINL